MNSSSSGGGPSKKFLQQSEAQLVDRSNRPREKDATVGNLLLFHGSRASNYVGLLSRGILLPKLVLSKGLTQRTDFGFLGHGIYFSDNSYSSLRYTSPTPTVTSSSSGPQKKGRKGRAGRQNKGEDNNTTIVVVGEKESEDVRYMLLVNVYCGKMKDVFKISPHLTQPPTG